jgi:hypothetical protein
VGAFILKLALDRAWDWILRSAMPWMR